MEDRNKSVCYGAGEITYEGGLGIIPWVIYYLNPRLSRIGLDDGDKQVLLVVF